MRKKVFNFLSLLAATMAIAACSSNDDVVTTNGNSEIVDDNAYMNVRISLSGNSTRAASRAATDAGFEAGTDEEYAVKTARFLFFDTNGTYKTVGHTLKNSGGSILNDTVFSDNNNIESTVNATVVLGPTTITGPLKMLTFLNYDETKFNSLIGKSLDKVLKTTTDVTPSKAGPFEMTNSAYVGDLTAGDDSNNNAGVVQYTYVPTGKFCSTAEAATKSNNYVTAYVERTVAKVSMTPSTGDNAPTTDLSKVTNKKPLVDKTDAPSYYIYPIQISGDNNSVSTFNVNDADGHLAVKVLGWSVNGYNTTGNLIKKISLDENGSKYYYVNTGNDATSTPFKSWSDSWNDAGNHRSYWAEDANYGTDDSTAVTAAGTTRDNLGYYTYDDVRKGDFTAQYIYENTVAQCNALYTPGEQTPNVTTMLIVGQVGTWNANSNPPFTAVGPTTTTTAETDGYIFRINGAYYTSDYIKSLLASKYYTTAYSASSPQTNLGTDAIGFVDKNSSTASTPNVEIDLTTLTGNVTKKQTIGNIAQFTVKLNNNTTLYEEGGTNSVNGDAVASYLLTALHATDTDVEIECYKNGYCYYQVPIEHPVDKYTSSTTTSGTIYGVVRNHTYKLTLNSISNIGDPIYNTDKDLEPIPGKDKYYYVGADINVLEWRKVTQNVEL